jgi:ATP-dependent Clp protease adaptor protein ClpS
MAKNGIKASDEKRDAVLVVEPKTRATTARPPFYKVMLLNDDYTPMDFVVFVLKQVFHKPHEEAIHIMLEVHNRGSGTCGIFTRDVAETKVEQVVAVARKNEHPLQCVMEKD